MTDPIAHHNKRDKAHHNKHHPHPPDTQLNSSPALTQLRLKYNDDRFQQLNGLLGSATSNTWTYLLSVNGGAAAGILAFIGSNTTLAKLTWPYVVLFIFVSGLVLVGFAHALIVHKLQSLTDNWVDSTSKYWHNELEWKTVLQLDKAMVNRRRWMPWVLGWLSLVFFLVGVISAAVGFQTLATG